MGRGKTGRTLACAVTWGLVLLAVQTTTRAGWELHGTISTSSGASIYDDDLANWIDQSIPVSSNRLLVMTQCFGGNSELAFAGKANTAVISATTTDQTSKYGGYHKAAALNLKPVAGTTAQDVHNAATAAKAAGETPTTGGALAPNQFSLDPITPTSTIKSRHVLNFMGMPEAHLPAGSDFNDAAALSANFTGQMGTTYRSVGGNGTGQFTAKGTARDLRAALAAIGNDISASPNAAAEQFILFIGDHGDYDTTERYVAPKAVPPAGGGSGIKINDSSTPNFNHGGQFSPTILTDDPNNVPGVFAFIPIDLAHAFNPQTSDPFHSGDWSMQINITGPGTPSSTTFSSFFDVFVELGDPSPSTPTPLVGDTPGEGVEVFFPIPESSFIDMFGQNEDFFLKNNTSQTWNVGALSLTSGEIARPVPEPATAACVMTMSLAALAAARRRRRVPLGTI